MTRWVEILRDKRQPWPHTHVSAHSKGTEALYCDWIWGEFCSLLEEECNCTWRSAVERIAEPSSPCWTLRFFFKQRWKKHTRTHTCTNTHTHAEWSIQSSNTYPPLCRVIHSWRGMRSDRNVSKWRNKAKPSTQCVCCMQKAARRWKPNWTQFKRITAQKSSRSS